MTAFDGLRNADYGPLAITAPRRRRSHWRRAWTLYGPLLLAAVGLGMLAGSWAALIVMELGI